KGTASDQSPLFKKVYEEEYGTPGGEPYGCLIGDYHFDHSPPDVEILQGIGQIAAAAHAPFISAANASLMNMGTWQELGNPRDLTKIFQTPEYAAWRSLRESENAKYIALTMPRFLGRLPYGAQTQPVDDFAFEDDTANANLAARLPYLFATCRFAHYLKCIVRDKIGSFKERDDMERWLNKWVNQFVTTDPNASDEAKSHYPLADAQVVVEEVAGN